MSIAHYPLADDGGDEQEHQHGDVEDDDAQQQEEHSGGRLCSAEVLPCGDSACRERAGAGREAEPTGRIEQGREERAEGGSLRERNAGAWPRARRPPAHSGLSAVTDPVAGRERAAAGRSLPGQLPAGPPATEYLCFWNKTSGAHV